MSYPKAEQLKIGQFVEGAIIKIGDSIKKVAEGVKKTIQAIGDAVMLIIDSLDFIAQVFTGLATSVGKLFTGDFAGAAKELGKAFNDLISVSI